MHAVSADPVQHVQSDAIPLLRQNSDAVPGIAETLARIAENDPKDGVRRQAHARHWRPLVPDGS